jgi:glutamyl-Q tRNA(Asp) synthetase
MTFRVTRFAPSPTGYLHIGHFMSADFAFHHGDKFILRIEDIDTTRCKTEFESSIYEDLKWMGLEWEKPVLRQSEHFADYHKTLHQLQEMGVIYPCFCTRKEIEAEINHSPNAPHLGDTVVYPQTCLKLSAAEIQDKQSAGLHYALRLNVKKAMSLTGQLTWFDREQGYQEARPDLLGDVVLARKDTPVSYHLCVTHDDARQGVNLVTRGEDLFTATHIHRLLQALMGWDTPDYHHHRLITDISGKKFSKRDKSLTLREIRNKGFSASQLRDMIEGNAINLSLFLSG